MKLPSPVAPGQPLSAKAFNELLSYVRSLELRGGPGCRIQRSAAGTTVSINEDPITQRPSAITHPFQATNHSDAVSAWVGIRAGSVNDVVTTTSAGTAHLLDSAGTWRVCLDCTLNTNSTGAVTAVAVAVTSGAQPANTRTHAYITLATVTVAATPGGFGITLINQLATHSLRFLPCGRTDSVDGTYQFWGF